MHEGIRVLVAIELGESAHFVLKGVTDVLKLMSGCELHALTVIEDSDLPDDAAARIAAMERAEGALTDLVEQAFSKANLSPAKAIAHVASGDAKREVVQAAVDVEADLIVLGTHGRKGLERLFLGSVAEHVVRGAPCPVVVVRAEPLQAIMEKSVPDLAPACPNCVETRKQSGGAELWCAQHKERQDRRHVYIQSDRVSSWSTNNPASVRLR